MHACTRYDEQKSDYSNYGSSLDLVAPGGDLDVDQNQDGYGDGVLQQTFKPYVFPQKADPTDWAFYFFDGTSMAAPHVSGVAALLLAQDPTLTPNQIRNYLESTAEDLGDPGRDDTYGWGLIDAQAALQSLRTRALVFLDGWEVDPRYTNEDYVLDSSVSSLFLQLNATELSDEVTIRHLGVQHLNLSDYGYVDVECSGTGNARIFMRFWLDDDSFFDVVYYANPDALNATNFDLGPYAGRALNGDVYVGLMSSDGLTASFEITEVAFVEA